MVFFFPPNLAQFTQYARDESPYKNKHFVSLAKLSFLVFQNVTSLV